MIGCLLILTSRWAVIDLIGGHSFLIGYHGFIKVLFKCLINFLVDRLLICHDFLIDSLVLVDRLLRVKTYSTPCPGVSVLSLQSSSAIDRRLDTKHKCKRTVPF